MKHSHSKTQTLNFRTGPPFPGTIPFVWTITGTLGELRITSERGPFLPSASSAFPISIEWHDFATDEVTTIPWAWDEHLAALAIPQSRDIGKLYDLYAEGGIKQAEVADFEAAVERHRQLKRLLEGK